MGVPREAPAGEFSGRLAFREACGVPEAAAAVMAAASMRNTRTAAASRLGTVVIALGSCGAIVRTVVGTIGGIIVALLDFGVGNQDPGADAGPPCEHCARACPGFF